MQNLGVFLDIPAQNSGKITPSIGGLLKHAPAKGLRPALIALTNPTTNSFKRLVPGYEAPVNLAYSQRNRSAACRIPMYSQSPKAKRIEFRCPDPACNPYLAFSAMLLAGLDGIQNKLSPGDPLDKDIYELSPEELAEVPSTPASLDTALDALEKDHAFLLKGDVFTQDVIETWISYKRANLAHHLPVAPALSSARCHSAGIFTMTKWIFTAITHGHQRR